MSTQYGFNFGPMVVERAIADETHGYAIHVTIGRRLLSIEATPHGRRSIVREHVGGNRWVELAFRPEPVR